MLGIGLRYYPCLIHLAVVIPVMEYDERIFFIVSAALTQINPTRQLINGSLINVSYPADGLVGRIKAEGT